MKFTEEDFTSIQAFQERAEMLKQQGDEKGARQAANSALQMINRTTVESIKEGNLSVDKRGMPTDVLTFSDISADLDHKAGKRGIELALLLIEDSPMTKEILAVLEKYVDGGNDGNSAS